MKRSFALVTALTFLLAALPAAAQTRYSIEWLGDTPTTAGAASQAFGINDLGHVVGFGNVTGVAETFLWKNGVTTNLGALPGATGGSRPLAVNNHDVVVGSSPSATGYSQAFKWENGVITGLGYLGDASNLVSEALDVNDQGLVVGYGGSPRPFKYLTAIQQLTEFPGAATGVNNRGEIAGHLTPTGWTKGDVPFLVDADGNLTLFDQCLSTVACMCRTSRMNNADPPQVVGQCIGNGILNNQTRAPFLITNNVMQQLPQFGDDREAWAVDVNDSGVVVGSSSQFAQPSQSPRAVVWENGQVHDLLTLVDNPGTAQYLSEARAINNRGQIVGWGTRTGQIEAFVLTPVRATPWILAEPVSITLAAAPGGPSTAASLAISNVAGETLSWSVASDATWLSVSPASGSQSGVVTVVANAAGMYEGTTHTAALTVTSNADNGAQRIPVTLTVSSIPVLDVRPSEVRFDYNVIVGSTGRQKVAIKNTGTGTMRWNAYGDQGAYVIPASGSIGSNAFTLADLMVPATAEGLQTLTVMVETADGTPGAVPVPVTMVNPKQVTLVYPNGGNTLHYGVTETITWSARTAKTVSSTSASYSTDGGVTWKLISKQNGLITSCSWRVPTLKKPGTQCLIKVEFNEEIKVDKKTTIVNVIASDVSDAFFTITR